MTDEHTSSAGTDTLQIIAGLIASNPLLPLLAVLGLYLATRLGRGRKLALGFTLTIALAVLGRVILGFDPETPDHYAYLLPAVLGLLVLSSLGVELLLTAVGDKQIHVGVVAAVSIAGAAILSMSSTWRVVDHSKAYGADEIARLTVDSVPSRGVALTSYFQTSFRVTALLAAEGARPDVAFIDRSFLSYPGERRAASSRHPQLTSLIESGLEPGRRAPIAALRAVSALRPLSIELHFNLGPDYHRYLVADGAFARFDAQGHAPSDYRNRLDAIHERTSGADRLWTGLHLLWTDYVHLLHACEQRDLSTAQRILERALASAPGDRMLSEVAADCGLRVPEP